MHSPSKSKTLGEVRLNCKTKCLVKLTITEKSEITHMPKLQKVRLSRRRVVSRSEFGFPEHIFDGEFESDFSSVGSVQGSALRGTAPVLGFECDSRDSDELCHT